MASNAEPTGATATDPVCGAKVEIATAQYSTNYDDGSPNWTTYYFDSDECKQLFERDPQRYVKAAR
ncbi:MAG TPA: YHS domain-containing protein [Ktedonobacterales bacterium]|jgi:YHS domain-containing protein